MLTVTSKRDAKKNWPRQVACARALVGALLLVFGVTANHPSWSQGDDNEETRTSNDEYPVQLNDVTFANIITWAAQAYVAPERLEQVVPLFVYPEENITHDALDNDSGNSKLYLGMAIQDSGDDGLSHNVWRARPIELSELTNRSHAGSSHIVASIQLEDVDPVDTLWVSESVWNSRTASDLPIESQ